MKLAKLAKAGQIGRLLFRKGIVPIPPGQPAPDSKSPAYYLLVVQESRARFCDLGIVLSRPRAYRNPFRIAIALIQWPWRYLQLKATLRIAEAFVLEAKLLEMSGEFRSRRGP